jgi:hypothetical protein
LGLKPPYPIKCTGSLSWDELYRALEQDLVSLPAADRAFTRYLGFSNRYNASVCDAYLEQDRWALNRLLNGLSSTAEVRVPVEVPESSGTLYRIDLRAYGLDAANGPFRVDATDFADGWQAIVAHDPYAVEFDGPNADNVSLQAETNVPFMLLDPVIAQVMTGSLYAGLLRLPPTQAQTLAELGIDPQAALAARTTVLAAVTRSELTLRPVLISRNAPAAPNLGYLYESFDFSSSAGPNLLADPLGFQRGEQAASKVLFTLPNGFLAYDLFDASGNRVDSGYPALDTCGVARPLRFPSSCFECHSSGVRPVADEVNDYARANPDEVAASAAAAGYTLDDVRALYPDNDRLQQILDQDINRFRATLSDAELPTNGNDPVAERLKDFESDVDLATFAGELGLNQDQLLLELPLLDSSLASLADGQKLTRSQVTELYVKSLCAVTTTSVNRPRDSACREAGFVRE